MLRVLFKCATEANPSGQQDSRQSGFGFWVLVEDAKNHVLSAETLSGLGFRVLVFGDLGFRVPLPPKSTRTLLVPLIGGIWSIIVGT